ncbi:MAG TPA: DegT/DnrJ/EryC1/StrS family aminotransferase, partial [bacterium]|nr:DegT/DnrJ/EryC1/StrS family aminotransferase [bacterium]
RTALFTRIPAAYLFRFTAAQARLGDSSLQRLPQVIAALRALAQTLTEDETIRRRLPALARDGAHAYWRLPLRTRALAQFSRQLLRHGIGTSTNLLPVCSELPGFRQYVRRPCPGALRAHHEYLLLPVHAWLTPSQRHRLCRVTSDLCRHAE